MKKREPNSTANVAAFKVEMSSLNKINMLLEGTMAHFSSQGTNVIIDLEEFKQMDKEDSLFDDVNNILLAEGIHVFIDDEKAYGNLELYY